jgi:hypothetical protein
MTRISRVWTHRENHVYIDVLQKITQSYNSTIHSSTGVAPKLVTQKNEDFVWRKLYGKYMMETPKKPKMKVGAIVRLSRVKDTFTKGYLNNWTRELFKIKTVHATNPPTYSVEDMNGKIHDVIGIINKFDKVM